MKAWDYVNPRKGANPRPGPPTATNQSPLSAIHKDRTRLPHTSKAGFLHIRLHHGLPLSAIQKEAQTKHQGPSLSTAGALECDPEGSHSVTSGAARQESRGQRKGRRRGAPRTAPTCARALIPDPAETSFAAVYYAVAAAAATATSKQ